MNYKAKFISDLDDHNSAKELANKIRLREIEKEKKEFLQLINDYERSVNSLFNDFKDWLEGTGVYIKFDERQFQSPLGSYNIKSAVINKGGVKIIINPLGVNTNGYKGALEVSVPSLLNDEKYSLNLHEVDTNGKGLWKLVTKYIAQEDDVISFDEEQFYNFCRKVFIK